MASSREATETCTACQGAGWNGMAGRVCTCQPGQAGIPHKSKPDRVTTPAAFPGLTICLPWHLRFLSPPVYHHGGECGYCKRNVAVPKTARRPGCLYCAMERGEVPMEEPGTIEAIQALPACFAVRDADLIGQMP